jgi:RHS repeat-associated protein
MTNALQNVVKSYDYSAFGKIISESGSLPFENPFTYTGREYDSDSGLYYYRARYYDADVGRFLSRDLLLFHVLRTAALIDFSQDILNHYRYVGNSPLNLKDPSGLCGNCYDGCITGFKRCATISLSTAVNGLPPMCRIVSAYRY